MRLVILGGPGAGKGTQAERLAAALGLRWISTGEILRTAIAEQTALGQQVKSAVERGDLVSDECMIALIRDRLLQPEMADGWVMEGYPRTAFQAEELDFLLDDLKQPLNAAIALEVSEAEMTARSQARAREDDTPEAIQRRLQQFQERTVPLLEYYELRGRLLRVDGNPAIEPVHQAILERLNS